MDDELLFALVLMLTVLGGGVGVVVLILAGAGVWGAGTYYWDLMVARVKRIERELAGLQSELTAVRQDLSVAQADLAATRLEVANRPVLPVRVGPALPEFPSDTTEAPTEEAPMPPEVPDVSAHLGLVALENTSPSGPLPESTAAVDVTDEAPAASGAPSDLSPQTSPRLAAATATGSDPAAAKVHVAPPPPEPSRHGPKKPPTGPSKGGGAVAPRGPGFAFPSPERIAAILAAGIGGLSLILAFVLFVSLALSRGYFGPGFRMFVAFAVSTTVWVAGEGLRRRSPWVAPVLVGVGFVGLLASFYGSHAAYHFMPGVVTNLAMLLCCLLAFASALKWNDRAAAALSLFGAYLTPVLLSTGSDQSLSFFLYLLVVVAGATGAAAWRGWAELIVLEALGFGMLFSGWTGSYHDPAHLLIALVAVAVHFVPYVAASMLGRSPSVRGAAVAVVIGLPLLLVPWVVPIDPLFTDTATGAQLNQVLPWSMWVVAAVLPLYAVPGLLFARKSESAWVGLGVAAVTITLGWVHGLSWGVPRDGDPVGWFAMHPGLAVLLGQTILGVVVALTQLKSKGSGVGASPMMVSAAALGGVAMVQAMDPRVGHELLSTTLAQVGFIAVTTAGFALATGLLVWPRGSIHSTWSQTVGLAVWLFAATVAGFGFEVAGIGLVLPFTLFIPVGEEEWILKFYDYAGSQPLPAGGTLAVTLGWLVAAPLLIRWPAHERTVALWWSAVAPVLFVPTLILAWTVRFGLDGLGLVPLFIGLLGVVGTLSASRLHRLEKDNLALAAFVFVAVTGITSALPFELGSGFLTVSLAVEAGVLAWVAVGFRHPILRIAGLVLTLIVGARLILNPWTLEYGGTVGWPIFNWTLYTWGVPAVAIALGALGYHRAIAVSEPEKKSPNHVLWELESWMPYVYSVTALLLGFALVNVEVSHGFQTGPSLSLSGTGLIQGMARSIGWAGYGVFVLVLGFVVKARWLRFAGFSFTMLATFKVFLVDLIVLSGFFRVGALLGLGFSLIVAALLFERLVLRESRAKEES